MTDKVATYDVYLGDLKLDFQVKGGASCLDDEALDIAARFISKKMKYIVRPLPYRLREAYGTTEH